MRRWLIIFVPLELFLLSCSFLQTIAKTTATPAAPDIFNTAWDDRSIFQSGLVASEQEILAELPYASVYHLEFNIARDLFHITGVEEVRYTNAEQVALDQVQLHLFPNILGGEMTISNLTVKGETAAPRYELQNSLLIVPLSTPLEPGQSVILRMNFAVTIPQTVDLNYGVLSYFENVLTLAHAYPMIAVYDDEGWNAEIPPQNGDVTYADAAFFLIEITAPKDITLVSTGRVIQTGESGESQTMSVASGPARDFYLVAGRDYQTSTQTFGEITIRSYAPQQHREGAEMAVEVAARAIEDFSARYAPYPYTELDIVSTPTLALGIEYPGMIAITSRIYDVGRDYRGTPASIYMESTVAHEVGHQWFYGLVGDDQLDDPWLDESLTQFATLQYYADEYGPGGEEGFRRSLEGRWDSIQRADIPIGLPVGDYTGQEYSAIVYGRGALFFIALRERMGAESFDAFLKAYTETLSWQVATPDVLQSMAEQHCACDLDDLFNEWVYP